MKEYANMIGYSDIEPFEVLSRTKRTILIRRMKATLSTGFKPEMIAEGFAAHCINQGEQEWIMEADTNAPIERAYLRKDGYFWSRNGRHKIGAHPVKFYDYNF